MDTLRHGGGFPHLHEHLVRHVPKLRQHILREGANLHPVLVNKLPQRRVVSRRVLRQHVLIDGSSGHFDDGLEIIGKRFEGLLIHQRFHHCARLLPSRIVVVFSHRVQAKGQVVVRTHPVRGVDGAGLQRRVHITPGHSHGFPASALEYLTPEARYAHAKPLHVGQGFNFLIEPAAHLRARIPSREGDQPKGCVELLPQLKATAVVEPAVHFLGREPEGHGGEEGRLGHLASPVVGSAVAHLGVPGEHRVEHLEGTHQLPGAIDFNLQAPVGHAIHKLRQLLRRGSEGREILRPGGDELPFVALALRPCSRGPRLIAASAGAQEPRYHHKRQPPSPSPYLIHRFLLTGSIGRL